MKRLFLIPLAMCLLTIVSCRESLEDRAFREAKEYTEKYCPTPPQNGVITDSMVFDKTTKTQVYYLRFTGLLDSIPAINEHRKDIEDGMLGMLRDNPSMQVYRDANFSYEYVCRSNKDPKTVLLKMHFGPKDYK